MVQINLSDNIDPHATIWKYFDLSSFLYLLLYKQLVFRRMDQFEDKLEGTIPEKARKEYEQYLVKMLTSTEAFDRVGTEVELIKRYKMWCYVNCWTINNFENYALWKLYAKDEGVAVKTTIKNLTDAVIYDHTIIKNNQPIIVRDVNYNGLGYTDVNQDNVYSTKYSAYSYESELRLFFKNQRPLKNRDKCIYPDYNTEVVKYTKVDLAKLIDGVVISPFVQTWNREMIKFLLTKKFSSLNLNIVESEMNEQSR